MQTTIYHNPRCSKSRNSLALVQKEVPNVHIVEYLKTPPTITELQDVLQKLGITASQLIRKSEAIYKEHYKGQELSEAEWLEAMVKHPKLIERPIIIHGDKAVIGRPIENVVQLLHLSEK